VSYAEITPEIVEGYQAEYVTTSALGHLIQDGFVDPYIRPLVTDVKIVGRAVTVNMPSRDTSANRLAVDTANPGDVIVADCRGDKVARFGKMICFDAKCKGIAGLIIDGAINASREIIEMGFPVFARTITGLTGHHNGPRGTVNEVIQCGGIVTFPGDLIVADDNGVVVIRSSEAAELLEECRQRYGTGKSESARRWIMSGRPYSQFPGVGWEERDDLPEPTRQPITDD